jgi:hypothetical protein
MRRDDRWQRRSPERLSDEVWDATIARVRGEFDEMPCIRVTSEQASTLLGVPQPASDWILERLTRDGFLARSSQGEYMRRT